MNVTFVYVHGAATVNIWRREFSLHYKRCVQLNGREAKAVKSRGVATGGISARFGIYTP